MTIQQETIIDSILKQFGLHFCHANFVHAIIFAKHLVLLEGLLLEIDQCFRICTRDPTQKFFAIAVALVSMLVAIDEVMVRNYRKIPQTPTKIIIR